MAIPPGLEVWKWIHLATPGFPIVGSSGARNPEVQVGQGLAGITGVPDQTEQPTGLYTDSRRNSRGDGGQVRTIVAQPVVADDGDRQAAALGRVVRGRIPEVLIGDEIHHAIRHGHKFCTDHGEDIGSRIAVTGSALGKAGRPGWLERKNVVE